MYSFALNNPHNISLIIDEDVGNKSDLFKVFLREVTNTFNGSEDNSNFDMSIDRASRSITATVYRTSFNANWSSEIRILSSDLWGELDIKNEFILSLKYLSTDSGNPADMGYAADYLINRLEKTIDECLERKKFKDKITR